MLGRYPLVGTIEAVRTLLGALVNFRTLRIDLFELAHKYLILAHNDKYGGILRSGTTQYNIEGEHKRYSA